MKRTLLMAVTVLSFLFGGSGISEVFAQNAQPRKSGVVYKSARFWQEFTEFDEVRKTFEGNFNGLLSSARFKKFYREFVRNYSDFCRSSLPEITDRHIHRTQDVTRDAYGVELSRGPVYEKIIYIDPRFTPSYKQFDQASHAYNNAKSISAAMGLLGNLRAGKSAKDSMVDFKSDVGVFEMQKFFKKVKCDSATMYQMNENMLRAAMGKKSLQADGVKIPKAEAESDSAEKIAKDKTFEQSCLDYHHKRDPSSSYDKWCSCLFKEAKKVMTPEEMAWLTDDFDAYFREIDGKQKGPKDPTWRLQGPLNNCRNSW
jgi:hypothetical protein